jgi:hypothetical protein
MSCATFAVEADGAPPPEDLLPLPLPSACLPQTLRARGGLRPSLAHSATSRAHLDGRRQHLTHKGESSYDGIRMVATAAAYRAQRASCFWRSDASDAPGYGARQQPHIAPQGQLARSLSRPLSRPLSRVMRARTARGDQGAFNGRWLRVCLCLSFRGEPGDILGMSKSTKRSMSRANGRRATGARSTRNQPASAGSRPVSRRRHEAMRGDHDIRHV